MVWTAENRGRYDRRGQRYPSDLTNEEWAGCRHQWAAAGGQGHVGRCPGPGWRHTAGEASGALVPVDQDRGGRWWLQNAVHRVSAGGREPCRRGRRAPRFRQRLRTSAQPMES